MITKHEEKHCGVGKSHIVYTVEGHDRTGGLVRTDISILTITGQNGDGPCTLFTSGLHGDEYEGPYALTKLFQEIDPAQVKGTIILMPAANPLALKARRRRAPVDDVDLNRAFPGNAKGLLAEAIAAFMVETLLPKADTVIDIHAAGDDSDIVPGPIGHFIEDVALQTKTLALMEAMRTPCAVIANEAEADTMWDAQVAAAGKVFLTAELGAAARLTPESSAVAWRAVQNAIRHLGHVPGALMPFETWRHWKAPRLLRAPSGENFVTLPHDGYFVPVVEPGAEIEAGQRLGTLLDVFDPNGAVTEIAAYTAGLLFSISTGGFVTASTWWTIIGEPVDWSIDAYTLEGSATDA